MTKESHFDLKNINGAIKRMKLINLYLIWPLLSYWRKPEAFPNLPF